MKLDATDLRYLSSDEFRVLTAVEMGSKNHEVVPTSLIAQISGLRHGGTNKLLGALAKRNLVAKVQNSKYDGYRLTYGGLDFLAMRAMSKRGTLGSVGNQIGVGKEADVYVVANDEGQQLVLKMHRLGRISFRAIKSKRDYLGKRKSASWMFMSRLAAQKEYAFMKVLHEHGFPVPKPVDQARHCILMELIDSYPLRQIASHPSPGALYSQLMSLIVRLARAGLVHGDFNEFNILVRHDTGEPVLIDFPQCVSVAHENAEWYFNRDVQCIRTFFRRRFGYESALYPRFRAALNDDSEEGFELDVEVAASGFGGREMKALEEYMKEVGAGEGEVGAEGDEAEVEEGDEEEDGEEEDDDEEGEEEDEEKVDGGVEDERLRNHDDLEDEEAEHLDGTHDPSPGAEPQLPPHGRHPPDEDDDEANETDSASSSSSSSSASIPPPTSVKHIVTTELSKRSARQKAKYHSGAGSGTKRAGKARGSKAKAGVDVRLGRSDVWG